MKTEGKRSNAVVSVVYTTDGSMEFHVHGVGVLPFDKRKASVGCRAEAEDHGWEQRIRDAAAIEADPETGKPATPAEKAERMKRLIEHYESGATEWALVGDGGGNKSITIEAIARVQGVDYDTAEKRVDEFAAKKYEGNRKKALAFLRDGERVMAAMKAIRDERTKKPVVDADAALNDLMA